MMAMQMLVGRTDRGGLPSPPGPALDNPSSSINLQLWKSKLFTYFFPKSFDKVVLKFKIRPRVEMGNMIHDPHLCMSKASFPKIAAWFWTSTWPCQSNSWDSPGHCLNEKRRNAPKSTPLEGQRKNKAETRQQNYRKRKKTHTNAEKHRKRKKSQKT